MARGASELACRLAREAEAVCRHYLSNGRRHGNYWLVGDVENTPGRSMFVRLKGGESGKGAAGKWTDGATADHGDLLDVIRGSCGLVDFHDVMDEARRFLSLPRPEPEPEWRRQHARAPTGSPESARRLFAMSRSIAGTVVETYLRNRGITALHGTANLRFHPRCYYRPDHDAPTQTWPAENAAAKMTVKVLRTGGGIEAGLVRALDQKGSPIGEARYSFAPQERETEAAFDLPVELRNDIARLEVAGERSAGAVQLLDKRWRRRAVRVVSGSSSDTAQPLLASTFYLTRALGPFADVRLGDKGAAAAGHHPIPREKAQQLRDVPEARKNFAVIVCRFDEMDWLLLKLTGHIRAKIYWKDNRIDASWVIP